MGLTEIITMNKPAIVKKWIDHITASYSADYRAAPLVPDRFADPLDHTIQFGLQSIVELLLSECEIDRLPEEVVQLVKLRAVQLLPPSKAVSFVLDLKTVVRQVCGFSQLLNWGAEWVAFDERLDCCALLVFDHYMASRESLLRIKVNEYRRGNHLMAETPCLGATRRKSPGE